MKRFPTIALFAHFTLIACTCPLVADFDLVVNIPPDPSRESIGSNTQLNLFDDGWLEHDFDAGPGSNIEVNIFGGATGFQLDARGGSVFNVFGGRVGDGFDAQSGSTVNISGGRIGAVFSAEDGSTVNVTGGVFDTVYASSGSNVTLAGGAFAPRFQSFSGATLRMIGGGFHLDGQLITGLDVAGSTRSLDVPEGAELSGIFADGTPFVFSSDAGDAIAAGTLTLEALELPPVGPPVIIGSIDPIPSGIREGQVMLADAGTSLPLNFGVARGSTLIVQDGAMADSGLEAIDAAVTIQGGHVESLSAFAGTQTRISGGTVGYVAAHNDSTFNISGGEFGFLQYSSAPAFDSGSVAEISGGRFGNRMRAEVGSQIELAGEGFRLDGVQIAGLAQPGDTAQLNIPQGATFSGTLADGTPIVLSSDRDDLLEDGTLTLRMENAPAYNTGTIVASVDPIPVGLRDGQTLRIDSGSSAGENLIAGRGSSVILEEGGSLGHWFEAEGADIVIEGGYVGSFFQVHQGTNVLVTGGTIGFAPSVNSGAKMTVEGGSLEYLRVSGGELVVRRGTLDGVDLLEGSGAFIEGGEFTAALRVSEGAYAEITGGEFARLSGVYGGVANISGGTFDSPFSVGAGSLNLLGTAFVVDGVNITDTLVPGEQFVITDRDAFLTTLLVTQRTFRVDLTTVTSEATLTVTRVRSGDFTGDGAFDCQDVDMLVAQIAAGADIVDFDLNADGVVDISDLDQWRIQAGAARLPGAARYLVGDANLDGRVNGLDFVAWNDHKFTPTASWCSGDFNADGFVDGRDFVLWNANKFTSAHPALARVPEPKWGLATGTLLLAFALRLISSMPREESPCGQCLDSGNLQKITSQSVLLSPDYVSCDHSATRALSRRGETLRPET